MTIKSRRIKCLIAIALFVRVSNETLAPFLKIRSTKCWSKDIYEALLKIYGDQLQLHWDEYLNFWKDVVGKFPSGYITDDMRSIRCPVFIMHGDLVQYSYSYTNILAINSIIKIINSMLLLNIGSNRSIGTSSI